MKNILVPTDFSSCAHKACDYGIRLASKADAKINFLHLQDTPVDWVKLSKGKEAQFPETLHEIGVAKSHLNDLLKEAEKSGVKANRTIIYRMGKEVVLKHLEGHDYDFLVMGSHGISGIKEKLIGTNAQYMIRNSSVPVLVIKSPIESEIKKIVFVSDFSDISESSFSKITDFVSVLNAHLDVLYVNVPKQHKDVNVVDMNMKLLVDAVQTKEGSIDTHHIDAESVEEGINIFSEENNIDLIAICTHGKSGISQLFSPSITEKIANHSNLPLLSIKL